MPGSSEHCPLSSHFCSPVHTEENHRSPRIGLLLVCDGAAKAVDTRVRSNTCAVELLLDYHWILLRNLARACPYTAESRYDCRARSCSLRSVHPAHRTRPLEGPLSHVRRASTARSYCKKKVTLGRQRSRVGETRTGLGHGSSFSIPRWQAELTLRL
jgi:hypothetical protein